MSELEAGLAFPLGGSGGTFPAYSRQLVDLLPPGPLWRLVGSKLRAVLDAAADELERVHDRAADLFREAVAEKALELLPEYEVDYDLASDGTDEERQARIVGRMVARQRYRPVDIQLALAALLGLDSVDVVVIERTVADAASIGDAREIFRFFVYRNPALPGTYYLAAAQELLDKIKPSHTRGHVIESTAMICDDPHSLCDRDLVGA